MIAFKGKPAVNAYARSVGMRTPRESTVMSYDQLKDRIVSLEQANKALKEHNRMLVARIKGLPAQKATEATDNDPRNPNSS